MSHITFQQLCMSRQGRRRNGGFALIELILVISISAILAIYANQELAAKSQETIARGGGTYLLAVSQAVERHVFLNFLDLEAGNPVAGTANPLKPTIPELIGLNRLRVGFPAGMPTRQVVRIDITRTGCPGAGCQITSTICTTTPITLGGAITRFDLATAMLEEQNGSGGQARYGDGANIRGAALNVPNPVGNVEGIVCGSSFVDVGMFDVFVRIGDTRDPLLAGPLTVAGATTLNGPTSVNNTLNVTGAATLQNNLTVNGSAQIGPCINLAGGPQGRAAFGCKNPADLPAGYTGGVRSVDVVANGNLLASDNPALFTGANGNYALVTANNGAGVAEIRTSGRAAADRLTPVGQFAAGAACAVADEGSIARLLGGPGLVSCTVGFWRVFTFQAAANDPCSPDGATARDASGVTLVCVSGFFVSLDKYFRTGTVNAACAVPGTTAIDLASGNEAIVCRINLAGGVARWMRLRDITSNLVFVKSVEVAPNAVVVKPSCNGAASQAPVPIIQLIPKVWGTPDGGQAFYAVDNGGSWIVKMQDGLTSNLQGVPNAAAIVQLYCYFP
jgi:prepilin-type N-terminal cleavage/methylation domain-containing protein